MEQGRRWRFLEDNPALVQPNWLPPEDEAPELAELRAEHVRLITLRADKARAAFELKRKSDAEAQARDDALREAYLEGADATAGLPDFTVYEDDLTEAGREYEAATDALQTFTQRATKQLAELAPDLITKLDARIAEEAEPLRRQALDLMARADAIEMNARRMRNWLSRADGGANVHLGHYPYNGLPAPDPERGGGMTISELWDATHDDMGGITEPDGLPPEGLRIREPGVTYEYAVPYDTDKPDNPDDLVTEVGSDAITDEEREAITRAIH